MEILGYIFLYLLVGTILIGLAVRFDDSKNTSTEGITVSVILWPLLVPILILSFVFDICAGKNA